MKTNKIIISSIASLLSIGVLAGSLALYTHYDPNKNIDIEMGEVVSKDATITIADNTVVNDPIITPENLTNTFNHKINYEKPGSFTQTGTMVDIKLEVTTADAVNGLLTYTPSFTGYGEYWTKIANGVINAQDNNAVAVPDKQGYSVKTYAFNDMPLDGTQAFNFEVKLTDSDNYYKIGKLTDAVHYKLSITKQANTKYSHGFIRGTVEGASWTEDMPRYEMVVDTQSKNFDWIYKNIHLTEGEIFKCKAGDGWSNGVTGTAASSFNTLDGGNVVVKTTGNYDLVWGGGAVSISQHA